MSVEFRARASMFLAVRRGISAFGLVCLSGVSYAQKQTPILPTAVAYDAAGDLYFADAARNQVFQVSLSGVMSVAVGTGEQGFGGDDGPALSAQLNGPQGVAVGTDGTLYIADTGNQRIRAVSGGTIRAVVGSGARGFAGDGGAATAAALNQPTALAMDGSGNLLICDTGNHRVRRVSGGAVTTMAGSGIQGFAGDGGAATGAELDSPMGVAVTADGRVIVADSHNHRLRVIGTDGVIQTFAGTGKKGYSGDGAAATAAQLFLPRGVSVTAAGDVLVADSDNHRIRKIDAQGVITTVAGDGRQGNSADSVSASAASLDTPRGVAMPVYGTATLADTRNGLVREVAADGQLYIVATPPARTTTVSMTAPASLVYGQGTAAVAVSSMAVTPQGAVAVLDGSTQIGSGSLRGGAAQVPLQGLQAGTHRLTVTYAGDGLNPAATSPAASVVVQPANVVATAKGASIFYGQAVPQMTGSETGILPQDTSAVAVIFTTTAAPLSPVGSYPITAQLSGQGSGNYTVTTSANSGGLTITQAQSTVQLRPPAQTTYAGLPLTLSAGLGSMTSGVPTGEIDFLDGGAVVAKAVAGNGIASGTYLAPTAGTHTLTAVYVGDGNFLGSASAPLTVTVNAMPDFSVAAAASTQTVQAGLIASYGLTLAPVGGPFTGSVTFSVSGLPTGAQASFSPSSVVPGAGGANITLSVQTPATLADIPGARRPLWWAFLPWLLVFTQRKRMRLRAIGIACCGFSLFIGCLGCGARTASTASQTNRTFPLVVTATSTDLAGSVVTHEAVLTLNVQ